MAGEEKFFIRISFVNNAKTHIDNRVYVRITGALYFIFIDKLLHKRIKLSNLSAAFF